MTKYRYKVLTGALRLRVRDICRQVCRENEVDILRGVLSSDHVHMFVLVPPKLAISDLVRKMKGRLSYRVQREFPAILKRFWGCCQGEGGNHPIFSMWKNTSLILPVPTGSRSVPIRHQ